jgi:hypothetical protein
MTLPARIATGVHSTPRREELCTAGWVLGGAPLRMTFVFVGRAFARFGLHRFSFGRPLRHRFPPRVELLWCALPVSLRGSPFDAASLRRLAQARLFDSAPGRIVHRWMGPWRRSAQDDILFLLVALRAIWAGVRAPCMRSARASQSPAKDVRFWFLHVRAGLWRRASAGAEAPIFFELFGTTEVVPCYLFLAEPEGRASRDLVPPLEFWSAAARPSPSARRDVVAHAARFATGVLPLRAD